ncbi:hypothetical protein Tco_0566967 [Tanacetum coccineum]
MAALKFASLHNMVAFLDKPTESDGFEQIVDFLNAHPIKYALTVNLTIYSECIEQFWATAEVKTVNEEVHIQALVDKKKVIITETSIRRDLQLADENGTECLPNATIFAELERIRQGKDFSGRDTPLFQTMMVQAQEEGEGSVMPTVPQHTPTINQLSSSQPPNKQKPRKSKKYDTRDSQPSGPTEPMTDETENVESVPTHSNDPLLSEIATLKEMVKKLERRNKSITPGIQRLRKVDRSTIIESPKDKGLGDQEDASKQGRKTADIDADEEVTLIDGTQGRNDDNLMFDIGVLDDQEVEVEKVVTTAKVTTASTTTTTVDELTLAQTLIEIKAARPKAVRTTATTTTTAVTRLKVRGVVVQEPSEFTTTTSQPSQLPQAKDKGNAKMVEPEKPLKKKDQIFIDEEIAQSLQEELQAKLEEEERLARQKEEDANIKGQRCLWSSWIKERSVLQDLEQRIKPPTKAQKSSQVSTYLKHIAGYKQNQLKNKTYDEIQKLFDKAMTRVNMFVDMDIELVKESSKKAQMVQESISKRAREEVESNHSKKQKLDENLEVEVDDEAEMKKHKEIVPDDEIAIDDIPLATKPPIIVT